MSLQEIIFFTSTPPFSLMLTGVIVGLLLALTGGGGSVVCVPLLLYWVKMKDVHMVIATSAITVAVSALLSLLAHASQGHVRWKKGILLTVFAVSGALIGAELGKVLNGKYLLLPFSLLMMTVALLMINRLRRVSPAITGRERYPHPRWGGIAGFTVGLLSGFLGIGGGFLVVPVLVWLFRCSTLDAIATSLMVVFAMGVSTSLSYALAGYVAPENTLLIILGGFFGGAMGTVIAHRLKKNTRAIELLFSMMLLAMALYMLIKNL
ncbi:sulfite exporter TauE/SafE family protein [Serratia nematodiphila]|uniref:sulfite exporter TauE/SafE family protein n=1 Tax=Serratia nematodiphila TaxID=458197 RepID=UPI0011D80385|nr:sulfite exporter TauE/SafE family protein [Serratia nematodiphila]TXE66649.1 sulfite exporter TauE/SafE family protein [Serratia nematodiphila]